MHAPSTTQRSPAANPRGHERFYRPELDGLRFVAFLLVFATHALPNAPTPGMTRVLGSWVAALVAAFARAGGFGVDLFFALSAYLLTELLLRERAATGRVDAVRFYVRRALRIWPLYYAFVAIAALALPPLLHESLPKAHVIGFCLMVGNWVCALRGFPSSSAAPLWSVSVEEQLYFVWPWLIRRAPARHLPAFLCALPVLALVARCVVVAVHAERSEMLWCNTFSHLDSIALGALCSPLEESIRKLPRWSPVVFVFAGLAAWTSVTTFFPLNERPSWQAALIGYPLVAAGSASILISALVGARGSGYVRALSNHGIVYLGKVSYGLYVFHLAALMLAARIVASAHGAAVSRPLLALVLTVIVASASYRWLERPFLRYKARFTTIETRPD